MTKQDILDILNSHLSLKLDEACISNIIQAIIHYRNEEKLFLNKSCDHVVGDSNYGESLILESHGYISYDNFDYCPKCGSKLND